MHLARDFRQWLHTRFNGMILLVYVPVNCTSVLQFADVVLNRPLKNAFTKKHKGFLTEEHRCKIASGTQPSDVAFSQVVSKAAGNALQWLISAYSGLQDLDLAAGLEKLRYPKCFCDHDCRFVSDHVIGVV